MKMESKETTLCFINFQVEWDQLQFPDSKTVSMWHFLILKILLQMDR